MSNKIVTLKDKLKEVFKHSIVYGLTSSMQSLFGFIMLPILTKYYTTEEFGIYSILLLMSALASAIFYLGASSALGRFYFEENSDEYRKKAISTALVISIIGAIILIVITGFFGSIFSKWMFNSEKYTLAIKLSIVGSAALGFLLNLMTLVLRYEKKSVLFFLITIIGVIINFGTTLLLLVKYHFGIMAPICGVLISNSITLIYLLYKYSKYISFVVEKKTLLLFLIFGVQASTAGLLFYVLDWVDRIIIKNILTLSDVGIYSLGYRLGSIINILLVMPFSLIWAPIRMQYGINENSSKFTTKIISYYTLIGTILILFAILFANEILEIFFKNKEYANASTIFPIVMLSLQFYGLQGIVDYGIYLHKKVYIYIVISILAIVINIALNYLLIPKFGYIAAAFVTLITYFFTTSLTYYISNKLHPMKIEWVRLVTPFILLSIIYLIVIYYPIMLIIKILVIPVVFIFLYLFWLNDEEKILINKKLCVRLKLIS
jgi:O-antigen/teichoic acid export membrane protein